MFPNFRSVKKFLVSEHPAAKTIQLLAQGAFAVFCVGMLVFGSQIVGAITCSPGMCP